MIYVSAFASMASGLRGLLRISQGIFLPLLHLHCAVCSEFSDRELNLYLD